MPATSAGVTAGGRPDLAKTMENFSLLGGPLQEFGARAGLVRSRTDTVALGVALGWSSWLVLVTLAVAKGGAGDLFSLGAVAIHARLLVAIPLLFVAETALDAKLREFVALLVRSEIFDAKALAGFEAAVARLSAWQKSIAPDAASLVAAVALSLFAGGLSTEIEPGRALSAAPWAGAWFNYFCLPLFRFLLFRWAWRLLLWWALLWRLAGTALDLSPAHPDRAGGLGYLETVHTRFAPLVFAVSVCVAAAFAEELALGETTLAEVLPALVTTLVVDCLLFLAPLCLFLFKFRNCREKGLREYALLSSRYVHAFERKWMGGASEGDGLLGIPDIQSLADLANSVEGVRKMRLAPISLQLVATLGVAAALPMLPLLLFDQPAVELAKLLFKKLAGL